MSYPILLYNDTHFRWKKQSFRDLSFSNTCIRFVTKFKTEDQFGNKIFINQRTAILKWQNIEKD